MHGMQLLIAKKSPRNDAPPALRATAIYIDEVSMFITTSVNIIDSNNNQPYP